MYQTMTNTQTQAPPEMAGTPCIVKAVNRLTGDLVFLNGKLAMDTVNPTCWMSIDYRGLLGQVEPLQWITTEEARSRIRPKTQAKTQAKTQVNPEYSFKVSRRVSYTIESTYKYGSIVHRYRRQKSRTITMEGLSL